jgi:hypothetical protein
VLPAVPEVVILEIDGALNSVGVTVAGAESWLKDIELPLVFTFSKLEPKVFCTWKAVAEFVDVWKVVLLEYAVIEFREEFAVE